MAEVPPEFVNMVETGIDFVRRMGLKVVELRRCHVVLKAPLDINKGHIGSIYAGALFTLAEIPGGALFLTTFDVSRFYPIVKEMTIKFKKPAYTDATVKVSLSDEEARRIEQEAQEKGKSEFTLNGQILDEHGTVVAESVGIYQIRKQGM
jgi:acyl-coenzyme A thioesterase PaaI-like protein